MLTDGLYVRVGEYGGECLPVVVEDAGGGGDVLQDAGLACGLQLAGPLLPLLGRVVLVDGGHHAVAGQRLGHLERAGGVHVGCHDGDALEGALGMFEGESALEGDGRA